MYKRSLESAIDARIGKGKAIVLIGPRQVGKTTLLQEVLKDKEHLFLNADDPVVRTRLTDANTEQIRQILGGHQIVFIDEAQRIPNIGLTLKLITDQFKQVQLLVSGSSAFDIGNEINEPLTGRKWEYRLYPVSWNEYENYHGYLKAEQNLHNRLLYGSYPDVLNHPGEEIEVLHEIVNSYLYKDILTFANIRKSEYLEKLVQALAFQIGHEVSYNELAQTVGLDKDTISDYIELLQKAFVIFKIGSYSRNLRNEIKTRRKIYFLDTGIRNMVIGNFSSPELRQDKGQLWENFLMVERLKHNAYSGSYSKMYFWRNIKGGEIDLVEDRDGKIRAWEFKWKAKGNERFPRAFRENYESENSVIDTSNFRELLMED